jgi:23S rRNA (guanosine2251-2'-O)-methyltransferase
VVRKQRKTAHRPAPGTDDGHSASAAEASEALIWGINPVLEVLRNPDQGVHEVLVVQGKAGPRLQEIIDSARQRGILLRFVPAERLGTPKNCRHQGVSARLAATTYLPLEALLATETGTTCPPPLLVLDCIQDPHNLGSILRSALAAGFSRIILPKERSAIISGTVAQSSAGAISHLQLCRVGNIAETLQQLKEQNYWVFGAVVDPCAHSLYTIDFPDATCLVIGGESKGIRPLVQKRCDQLITIPMAGSFNSLNASVAAAIIMFEFARRRLPGTAQP